MDMRKQAGLWLVAGVVACIAGWGLREGFETAQDAHTTPATMPTGTLVRVQGDLSTVGEQHPIRLDAAMARRALRDGELHVALPDGTYYAVAMERQETDKFGQWSVIGRVRTPLSAQAMVLTFGGDAVFGTLPLPDGRALQIVTNHGRTLASLAGGLVPLGKGVLTDVPRKPSTRDLVAQRAKAWAASGKRRAAASQPMPYTPTGTDSLGTGASTATPPTGAALPTSPVTVTVLATYADDLIALRGSEAAVHTQLSNLVVAANQAHIDSGTLVRLQLVARQKLAIASSDDNYDALFAMTVAPIGDIDTEVLRDQHAADLVTFVRPYNDYETCGIAWVAGAGNYGTMTENLFGYSVVNTEPCGPHVMAHEVGHNLGSAHDRATAFSLGEYEHGAFPFSFGYRRTTAPAFSTIMAYAEDEPWLGRFSNPLSSACGAPCGVALKSDNVRSLNLMAKTVSEFRTAAGKATISDVEAWEPDPDSGEAWASVPIRINGFAGEGKQFYVEVVGGTATKGVDYPNYSGQMLSSLSGFESEALFRIHINPDTLVEGDETIILKLTSPTGYPIADDTAVVTIRDDDPRPRVRVQFQPEPDPTVITDPNVRATVYGLNGPRDLGMNLDVPQTHYSVDMGVAPGSNIELLSGADGFSYSDTKHVFLPQLFNDVLTDHYRTVAVPKGKRITGQVVPPTGDTLIYEQPATVDLRELWNGRVIGEGTLTRCCFWETYVHPGSTLEMRVDLQFQYLPWYGIRQDIRADTVLNADMKQAGTIVVRGGTAYADGRAGRLTRIPVAVEFVRGPEIGTINVKWRTVDGSAVAGKDYVAASGTATLTNAEPMAMVWVDIIGDNAVEGSKSFNVVIDPVPGYNITNNATKVTITDDEMRTGGPQQKQ